MAVSVTVFYEMTFEAVESAAHQLTPAEITCKLQLHQKMVRSKKTQKRVRMGWSTVAQSAHSKNTVNPIRKIADAMNVPCNPAKSTIRLNLGDPTITGKLPPSQVALDALQEAILSHKHDGYGPSVGEVAARQAVADKYSTNEAPFTADDVILASGCSHAIQMAIEALADPGDNILIPHPGFPLYSTLCRPHGIEDRAYKLDMKNGGRVDLDQLESLIDENTRAIIITNPGNPTGVVFPKEHLEQILEIAARYHVVIIADEIYGDLVYGGAEFHPMATLSPKVPIISCDGIAKRWMVPGWRLGWVTVHNRFGVLDEVKKGMVALSQKIVGPCALIQGALPKILKDTPEEYFEYNRSVISRNADVIYDILKTVPGLLPLKPQGAMYMMVGVDKVVYGDEVQFVQNLIQEESVIAFPGSAFSAPGWIRLVITHDEETMAEAALRMRDFCARLAGSTNVDLDSSDEGCDISNSEPEC